MLILPRTKEVLALHHVRISDSVNEWSCIRRNEENGQKEFGANSTGVEGCLFLVINKIIKGEKGEPLDYNGWQILPATARVQ